MRTTKELLEVMLENIDKLEKGLCKLAWQLQWDGLITNNEEDKIVTFLIENLPERTFAGHFGVVIYCWKMGEKQPRIDWLKQEIEKPEQTK